MYVWLLNPNCRYICVGKMCLYVCSLLFMVIFVHACIYLHFFLSMFNNLALECWSKMYLDGRVKELDVTLLSRVHGRRRTIDVLGKGDVFKNWIRKCTTTLQCMWFSYTFQSENITWTFHTSRESKSTILKCNADFYGEVWTWNLYKSGIWTLHEEVWRGWWKNPRGEMLRLLLTWHWLGSE